MHIETLNEQVVSLNERLRHLASEEENLVFIDNDPILTIDNIPNSDFYSDRDCTGVHLNMQGLAALSSNMNRHLNEFALKTSNDTKWDVQK